MAKRDQVIVNTTAVAKMFGMTERRVRQLVEEGIIERVAHGRYDIVDTVNRYIKHLKLSSDAVSADDIMESLEYERFLHEKAKREKAEIELSHLKGQMHKASAIESVMNDMLMAFRGKLLGLPTKLAPELVSIIDVGELQELLQAQMFEVLEELSYYDPAMFVPVTEGDDDEQGE